MPIAMKRGLLSAEAMPFLPTPKVPSENKRPTTSRTAAHCVSNVLASVHFFLPLLPFLHCFFNPYLHLHCLEDLFHIWGLNHICTQAKIGLFIFGFTKRIQYGPYYQWGSRNNCNPCQHTTSYYTANCSQSGGYSCCRQPSNNT